MTNVFIQSNVNLCFFESNSCSCYFYIELFLSFCYLAEDLNQPTIWNL